MINPILDLNQPELASLVYVKTNVGGWFFDAFLKVDHQSKLKITEHPVQSGTSITDHAFLEPRILTMEIGMSDASTSYVSGQFTHSWSRSASAYDVLRELQSQRVPMQILTRLGLYKNMLLETLSAPDDYTTLNALKATAIFKEVKVATVQTVKVSANPQKTDSTVRGQVQPVPIKADETVMTNMKKLLFGG